MAASPFSPIASMRPSARMAMRQGQVVVDRLGDVGDADAPARAQVDLAAGEGGVVAADGDQPGDVEAVQYVEDVAHVLLALGRVGARGSQHGAAADVEALDLLD